MQKASLRSWILLGLLPVAAIFDGTIATHAQDQEITAVQYERKTIYHSPQTPGFTCWTGTWVMPDGSVMVCFTQATGPVKGRPHVPKEIGDKLCWPPPGRPLYDMTGLDLRNVHLRSFDGGQTWGPPEVLLDPEKYSAWPKRIRQLSDGRLIVLGGMAQAPANSLTRHEYGRILEPLLMVSEDDGKTWSPPIPVVPPEHRQNWGGEEFDAAELPGGDLLCVFRRLNPDGRSGEVRWQGLLKKDGAAWVPERVGPAPFPHSGHPELLATREGVVLHVATSGVDWTGDAGRSWRRLNVPPTGYYPRAVQAPDGHIYVFAHVGGDNAYGSVDQSIVMDTFRLEVP